MLHCIVRSEAEAVRSALTQHLITRMHLSGLKAQIYGHVDLRHASPTKWNSWKRNHTAMRETYSRCITSLITRTWARRSWTASVWVKLERPKIRLCTANLHQNSNYLHQAQLEKTPACAVTRPAACECYDTVSWASWGPAGVVKAGYALTLSMYVCVGV